MSVPSSPRRPTLPTPARPGARASYRLEPTLVGTMTTHQPPTEGVPPPSGAGTFQGTSLPEAARMLGVSPSSIRRMIRDGRLEARRVLRPQGYAWEVSIPAGSGAPSAEPHHTPGPERFNPPGERPAPTKPEAAGAWLAPVLTPILAPLVAELTASRLANEQKAETIGQLRERLDYVTAELDALRASHSPVAATGAAGTPDPSTEPSTTQPATWWRRWWAAVYGW
jgi:hypothetical protein